MIFFNSKNLIKVTQDIKQKEFLSKFSILKNRLLQTKNRLCKENRLLERGKQIASQVLPLICIALIVRVVIAIEFKMQLYICFKKTIEIIVMSMGYTGVLLALYYSNYNTLVNNSYKNAPIKILKMLSLNFSTKPMRLLISNIVMLLTYIIIYIKNFYSIEEKIGLISAFIIVISIILITLSYQQTSGELIEYNNQFKLSENILKTILETINVLPKGYVDSIDVKNEIYKVERENIANSLDTLKVIIFYNLKENKNNEAFAEQIVSILNVVFIYSKYKKQIQYNSDWFPTKEKYSKYYNASFAAYDIANMTGTLPLNEKEIDSNWIEMKLFNLVDEMYVKILKDKDLNNIILYLEYLHKILPQYSYSEDSNLLFNLIEKQFNDFIGIVPHITNEDDKIACIYERFAVVFENIALSLRLYLSNIDYVKTIENSIKIIKDQNKNKFSYFINEPNGIMLYSSCNIEIINEGKIVTSDKFFIETISLYINRDFESIEELVIRIYNCIYKIAQCEEKSKRYYTALVLYYVCITYINRLGNIDGIINDKRKMIRENYSIELIDENKTRLSECIKADYGNIFKSFGDVLIGHLLNGTDNSEGDMPDFYGYYINESLKYLLNCINENDIVGFSKVYEKYIYKILYYQEKIRTEVVNKDYNSSFIVKSVLEPFIRFCKISSMAIIYGTLMDDNKWIELINVEFEKFYNSENGKEKIALLLKSLSWYKNSLTLIDRDFSMTRIFENIIGEKLEEYIVKKGIYGPIFQTQDSLLNDYLKHRYFHPMGFEDIEEFYVVKVINEKLNNEEKYKSKTGWEKNGNN